MEEILQEKKGKGAKENFGYKKEKVVSEYFEEGEKMETGVTLGWKVF